MSHSGPYLTNSPVTLLSTALNTKVNWLSSYMTCFLKFIAANHVTPLPPIGWHHLISALSGTRQPIIWQFDLWCFKHSMLIGWHPWWFTPSSCLYPIISHPLSRCSLPAHVLTAIPFGWCLLVPNNLPPMHSNWHLYWLTLFTAHSLWLLAFTKAALSLNTDFKQTHNMWSLYDF